jgi:hypothetical protein
MFKISGHKYTINANISGREEGKTIKISGQR